MINMTARNFDLTEGIKSHVIKSLDKIEKYLDEGHNVDVVMEANDYGQKIEVSLSHNGNLIRASSIDKDLYTASDLVSDKMEKQLRRSSDKLRSKRKKSIRHMNSTELDYLEEEDDDDYTSSKIVKRKVISAKPMFEEEAIEQMDLLDHRSFIFFNATTNTICMLYKRHDNDYGIIEAV